MPYVASPSASPRVYAESFEVRHWNHMPVKVRFIEDESYQLRLKKDFLRGMSLWISAEDRLEFKECDKNEDITVRFDLNGMNACTHTSFSGQYLTHAEITIGVENPYAKGALLDDKSIQVLSCHEAGHAFGIICHNYDETSIMFPFVSKEDYLTEDDVATLDYAYGWKY